MVIPFGRYGLFVWPIWYRPGTLIVDGWTVILGTAAPPSPLIAVPNVTVHAAINGQYTNFILFDVVLYLCALNG